MKTTTRTMGVTVLAGMMTLGMGACTQVDGGSANSNTSAPAAGGAESVNAAASSAAAQASSAAASATAQASAPSAASSAASQATSAPATSEAAPTSDAGGADAGSGPKVGKVGEEVKTAEMSAKVSKISDPIQSKSEYHKPDAGKHFVAVNISMTNLGSKDLRAGTTCMKVKLDDNTSAQEDFGSHYGQDLEYSTLYKGDTTTGDVVYEVPDGKKIKTIDVKCGYGDEQAIRIQAQ